MLVNAACTCGVGTFPQSLTSIPFEAACILLHGKQFYLDISPEIRFHVSWVEARKYYISYHIFLPEAFDKLDLIGLRRKLEKLPKMCQICLSKKVTNWCTSG